MFYHWNILLWVKNYDILNLKRTLFFNKRICGRNRLLSTNETEGTMGKAVTKDSSNTSAKTAKSSSDELIARIDQLEKMLIHTKKKRICQSIVVWVCAVIIISVCAWFLISFNNLIRNYDAKLLMQELQNNSGIVVESPQFHAMMLDMKKIFVPAYKKALRAKLKADTPKLQAKAEVELHNLKKLMVRKVQDNFVEQVHKDFHKVEQDLLKRYPDLDSGQLDEAYKKASALFVDKLSGSMNQSVKLAVNKLAGLDETFRQFKKEKVYTDLKKKSIEEVESLLLESILELWIYELNPAKGEKLADAAIRKPVKRNK